MTTIIIMHVCEKIGVFVDVAFVCFVQNFSNKKKNKNTASKQKRQFFTKLTNSQLYKLCNSTMD